MKKEYITPKTDYVLVNIEELLDMGASGTGFEDIPGGARESAWSDEEEEVE